jgi:molybdenum cofactor cytidylyltransferase
VNLFAETAGLLVVDAEAVNRLNRIDESITLATLAPYLPGAGPGEWSPQSRSFPFAVPGGVLDVAESLAQQARPLLSLHPFQPLKVGLVLTELPGLKEKVMEGAVEATRDRVEALCGTLLPPERCRHEASPVSDALTRLRRAGAQILLVAGASAVVDRRDVGPAGIVRAGGAIDHFGMPVDPGNLICLGHIDGTPALVLPGCARSPKLNGIDWVLQRLLRRLGRAAGRRDGHGRRRPAEGDRHPPPPPRRSGERPGAGAGSTAGAAGGGAGPRGRPVPPHGAVEQAPGAGHESVPMVARVVDNVLGSHARPVVVVTGHERERVEAALAGRPVLFAHAEDYAEGLSASLKAGLAALPPGLDGVVVCLGDMPLVAGP